MNREEILEKSKKEYKNQDIFEKEVIQKVYSVSTIVTGALAIVFFILQIIAGKGINYSLYAIVFAMQMSAFWVKWLRLKRKHELVVAICYTVMVILLSTAHIYQLFTV